jgi:hypothetical protein
MELGSGNIRDSSLAQNTRRQHAVNKNTRGRGGGQLKGRQRGGGCEVRAFKVAPNKLSSKTWRVVMIFDPANSTLTIHLEPASTPPALTILRSTQDSIVILSLEPLLTNRTPNFPSANPALQPHQTDSHYRRTPPLLNHNGKRLVNHNRPHRRRCLLYRRLVLRPQRRDPTDLALLAHSRLQLLLHHVGHHVPCAVASPHHAEASESEG